MALFGFYIASKAFQIWGRLALISIKSWKFAHNLVHNSVCEKRGLAPSALSIHASDHRSVRHSPIQIIEYIA